MPRDKQPVATLGELLNDACPNWFWFSCIGHGCGHASATTFAWAVIRYGPDASSDILRERARCTHCGQRGALLTRPSWGGMTVGWVPFPVDRMREADKYRRGDE